MALSVASYSVARSLRSPMALTSELAITPASTIEITNPTMLPSVKGSAILIRFMNSPTSTFMVALASS